MEIKEGEGSMEVWKCWEMGWWFLYLANSRSLWGESNANRKVSLRKAEWSFSWLGYLDNCRPRTRGARIGGIAWSLHGLYRRSSGTGESCDLDRLHIVSWVECRIIMSVHMIGWQFIIYLSRSCKAAPTFKPFFQRQHNTILCLFFQIKLHARLLRVQL